MEGRSCQLYGLDPFDAGIRQANFQFICGDMDHIPFPDKFFDVTLSFGVMEHIEPFEKLSAGIKEMVRVGKQYCMVVPCISTRFEPHCWKYKWQMKSGINYPEDVNYMSDAAWTKFEGFKGAKVARFDYIPLLITNLMIYGSNG